MSEYHDPRGPGRGALSARNLLLGGAAIFLALALFASVTPSQAAYAVFLASTSLIGWVMSRGALEGIEVSRDHRRRVFQDDPVSVELVVKRKGGLAQSLILVEDQFLASLNVRQRHLIPLLAPRWEARLHYRKEAERHRGLYLLGPVRLWAADPLGIFFRRLACDCITRLTVYPRATPLGGYRLLGPSPPTGPAMETAARRGEGEEIVSVRPYRAGDPMNRIHWRTSARRGELYTMELDSQVQSEIGVYLDLTRGARFGSGAESTTEIAIGCAVSILTEAATLRHRVSLAWVRSRLEAFPSGAGAAHLHMLLDRLATVSFGGERPFWIDIAEPVSLLKAGSRAIFIAPAATTPAKPTSALVRRLVLQGVAADVILLDESRLMRVFSSQDPTHKEAEKEFARLRRTLERAGARVLPLAKGEGAARLMPAATEEPAAQTARRA